MLPLTPIEVKVLSLGLESIKLEHWYHPRHFKYMILTLSDVSHRLRMSDTGVE